MVAFAHFRCVAHCCTSLRYRPVSATHFCKMTFFYWKHACCCVFTSHLLLWFIFFCCWSFHLVSFHLYACILKSFLVDLLNERPTRPAIIYRSVLTFKREEEGARDFWQSRKKIQGQMVCFLFTLPSASLFFSFRFSMSLLTFYTILRIQPKMHARRPQWEYHYFFFLLTSLFFSYFALSIFWSISFEQYDSWTLKSTEWFWLWHTTPLDLSWKLKKFRMHRDSFTSHSYRTFHFIHPILFVTFNDITTQLFTKVISFELYSVSRLHRQQKNATKSIENERISRLFQMKWCHRKYIKFIVLTTTSVSAKNGTRKQHRVCGKHVY